MLSDAEKVRLATYKSMATMNGSQALDYHELLVKEAAVQEAVADAAHFEAPVYVAVAKPKKRKK